MIEVNGTFTDENGKNRAFTVVCEYGVIKNNHFPSERWSCKIDNQIPVLITRNKEGKYTFPENFPSVCDTGKNKIQEAIEIEIEKIKIKYNF